MALGKRFFNQFRGPESNFEFGILEFFISRFCASFDKNNFKNFKKGIT